MNTTSTSKPRNFFGISSRFESVCGTTFRRSLTPAFEGAMPAPRNQDRPENFLSSAFFALETLTRSSLRTAPITSTLDLLNQRDFHGLENIWHELRQRAVDACVIRPASIQ